MSLLHALSSYTGTVVFVSHDRYFIDKLATRVFEVGDGRVEIFPGNYEDYLWRKQGGAETLQKTVVARNCRPADRACQRASGVYGRKALESHQTEADEEPGEGTRIRDQPSRIFHFRL